MLRQDPSRNDPEPDGQHDPTDASASGVPEYDPTRAVNVDIQAELERLKEMIVYGSLRIPFTRYTLVDEDQLLDQIELVQFNLPKAFDQAAQVVEQRDEIILDTKEYAQELILAAEQQAADILDEMTLVQQAKLEAQQIRLRVQQECEAAKADTLAEIDSIQTLAQHELEEMRRAAIQECEALQQEADDYADGVLREMEDRLTEMLRVIRNGRQQLYTDDLDAGNIKPANRNTTSPRGSEGTKRKDGKA